VSVHHIFRPIVYNGRISLEISQYFVIL
jgi:hypothetical protein